MMNPEVKLSLKSLLRACVLSLDQKNSEIAQRWKEVVGEIEEADDFSIQSETFGRRNNDDDEQKQSEPLELELRGPYSEKKNEIAQRIKTLLRMKRNPEFDSSSSLFP